MSPAHVPAAAELERLCFSLPRTARTLEAELQDPHRRSFAALDGPANTLCGFASFQYVLDEGNVENIAVATAYRRRGIGRALLRAMEQAARALSLAFLTLEVRAGNAAAIALYGQAGYHTVGLRRHYYTQPREDARLMTKFLKPGDPNADSFR